MHRLLLHFTLLLFLSFGLVVVSAQEDSIYQKFNEQKIAMGSAFSIVVVSNDEAKAKIAIDAGYAEIERIEKLISSWDPNSQTSEINRQAGIRPVHVDKELFSLIYRCRKISKLTDGAFDISYASIDNLWKFDGSMKELPDSSSIQQSIQFINYKNIQLNRIDTTVFLKYKGMKIGFGAIGKGYAANQAMFIMLNLGVKNGLVNAGGDLIAWGKDDRYQDWGVAIADPNKKDKMIAWLSAFNTSVVTSGDYEKYAEIDGKRYSHIINPKTGYPTTGIKSVTIVWFDAELADALATSVFVLGEEKGLALINDMKGVECLIVTDENEIITSKNLSLKYEK